MNDDSERTQHTREQRRRAAGLVATYEREFGDRLWPWRSVQPLLDAGWDALDVKAWLVSPHPALSGQRPADRAPNRRDLASIKIGKRLRVHVGMSEWWDTTIATAMREMDPDERPRADKLITRPGIEDPRR